MFSPEVYIFHPSITKTSDMQVKDWIIQYNSFIGRYYALPSEYYINKWCTIIRFNKILINRKESFNLKLFNIESVTFVYSSEMEDNTARS